MKKMGNKANAQQYGTYDTWNIVQPLNIIFLVEAYLGT